MIKIGIVLSFALILCISFARISPNPRAVIWSDAEGYYKYLPGLFILKDFHQLDPGSVFPYYNQQGEYVNKYSCGVAYFQAPFFLIALGVNRVLGNDLFDYYNHVYAKAMAISGVLAGFLGLLLLATALSRHYSKAVAIWTILCVFLGTNLFHYTTKEMGISHVYSFFLFSSLLFYMPFYLKRPGWFQSILLGAILGWIIVIRPTNAIVVLVLLGYDVYSWQALKSRFRFFARHFPSLLLMGFAAFVMIFPQLLYWKEMTGHWMYYSYTNEKFIYWN